MNVFIGGIAKSPAAAVGFDFEAAPDDPLFDSRLDDAAIAGGIAVQGTAENEGDAIIGVNGKIKLSLSMQCARCLTGVVVPLEIDFSERFAPGESDDDSEEVYVYHGDTIELSDMTADSILANIPMRALCREDCKGLCPVCGADRNTTPCKCEENAVDPRMEALKALLDE